MDLMNTIRNMSKEQKPVSTVSEDAKIKDVTENPALVEAVAGTISGQVYNAPNIGFEGEEELEEEVVTPTVIAEESTMLNEEGLSITDRFDDVVDALQELLASYGDHVDFCVSYAKSREEDGTIRDWDLEQVRAYASEIERAHDRLASYVGHKKRQLEAEKKMAQYREESQPEDAGTAENIPSSLHNEIQFLMNNEKTLSESINVLYLDDIDMEMIIESKQKFAIDLRNHLMKKFGNDPYYKDVIMATGGGNQLKKAVQALTDVRGRNAMVLIKKESEAFAKSKLGADGVAKLRDSVSKKMRKEEIDLIPEATRSLSRDPLMQSIMSVVNEEKKEKEENKEAKQKKDDKEAAEGKSKDTDKKASDNKPAEKKETKETEKKETSDNKSSDDGEGEDVKPKVMDPDRKPPIKSGKSDKKVAPSSKKKDTIKEPKGNGESVEVNPEIEEQLLKLEAKRDFYVARYGSRADEVMLATATKLAEAFSKVKCKNCGGTGKVTSNDDLKRKSMKGKKPTEKCFSCSGTGKVRDMKEERVNSMAGAKLKISRDTNGNKILKVSIPGAQGFSVQTNGNLVTTHSKGINSSTEKELRDFISKFGTVRQKQLLSKV